MPGKLSKASFKAQLRTGAVHVIRVHGKEPEQGLPALGDASFLSALYKD